jgi:ribose transport system substrate-binding protein
MPRRALLALAAAALALSGCGDTKPAAKYRVAVIPKGLSHAFWQSIHRGALRAASDLGARGIPVEILWDGPTKESDAREQIALVEAKSNMGIAGLVLAPQHSKQMVGAVEEVGRRNIPVVIIDSGLDPDALKRKPDLILKYVATDNYHGGQLAARHLLDVLARDGKKAPRLVLFRYQPGSESTEQREQGFLDAVEEEIARRKKAGEPAPQWLDKETYAQATVESAEKNATALLNRLRGKGLDGVFAVNESSAVGMLNALRSLELAGKVRFVGFDSSDPLLQGVREQHLDGLIVQDPYRMGYLGVWTVVWHLEGRDVSAGGRYLGTGENVLTRANLEGPQMKGLFDPEAQARRSVEAPDFPPKKASSGAPP